MRKEYDDMEYLDNIPSELIPHYYYFRDIGHSILCVLKTHLDIAKGKMDDYEVPIPVKYVLEKGYEIQGDHVIVDAEYDSDLGVIIDESYSEYRGGKSTEKQLQLYSVGEKRPEFAIRQDSIVFDIDDSGAVLYALFNKPTQKEIDAYKEGEPLEVRMTTIHDIIFMLFKFGSNPWIDAPYSPHLSVDLTRALALSDDAGYALTVILADSSTGEVKGLRYIGIPRNFSEKLNSEIGVLRGIPFSRKEYDDWLGNIYATYTTRDMVKMSSTYFKI